MVFGQVVIGPLGSRKTTYCNGMSQFLQLIGRTFQVFAGAKLISGQSVCLCYDFQVLQSANHVSGDFIIKMPMLTAPSTIVSSPILPAEREIKFEKASEKGQKISSSALFSFYYRLLQLEIQIRISKLALKLQSYQSVSLRSDSPSQLSDDIVEEIAQYNLYGNLKKYMEMIVFFVWFV
ncbi:hypothetical protein GBA52_001894 [Prunus armeniaca]|nr:hypothetical protein GBA52_001894 [Prunus armeniaca]